MDQLLFDLNPNPVLIYDTETLGICKANEAFYEKYGYHSNQGLTIKDIRPSDDINQFEGLANLNKTGTNEVGTARHQAKSGEIFYVNVSSHDYFHQGLDARLVVIHDITERVKAEKRAQEAFHELNHHVNHSPLAMIKWDAGFHVIEWSRMAEEVTGYSSEMVKGKTPHFFDFFGDDLTEVEKNMEFLISGQRDKTNFEVKMYHKDHSLVDLRVHASVLRREDDSIISVLTFMEDITEQKKAELKYQRLFENANDGIFLMDETQFIECNEQVLKIFGCTSKEQILGKTPLDFSPEIQSDGEESAIKARRKIKKAFAGSPQVFEWKHVQIDGKPIDVEVSLNRLELVGEVYIQAMVRDLTKQKKAQKKVRKHEQLFRKLFLKAPGAMLMVDKDNRVQMVNQSFEELFGYAQKELVGKDINELIVPDEFRDDVPRMPGYDIKDGKFYKDVRRYTKSGEARDVLLGAIPVFLDNEPIAGFGIYIDITEQKENERKLKQSLQEKQVLLEEIHHRVKNNLAIVSGLLQMQVMSVDEPQFTNLLQDSQLRIQSMAIVHEMLYQSEMLSHINMDGYVKKLVQVISDTLSPQNKNIEVEVETNECILNINQAIPCALNINELVTNSFEYAFENRDEGKIIVRVLEHETDIQVTVHDNGIGLPDNFETMRKTSLGMSLIENLTKQLEADMTIDSGDWGTQTSFSFKKANVTGSSSSGRV